MKVEKPMGKLIQFPSHRVVYNKPAEDVNPSVHKAIRRMINNKPTSYQAVSWIKRELQKRKR